MGSLGSSKLGMPSHGSSGSTHGLQNRHDLIRLLAIAVGLSSMGCVSVEHRASDLQFDLVDSQPSDIETVRVCVEGVGVMNFTARERGSYAFTGIPVDAAVDVVISVVDLDGNVVATAAGEDINGYDLGELSICDEGECTPCEIVEELIEVLDESWLLSIRFLG
jgi:hypothetical protein